MRVTGEGQFQVCNGSQWATLEGFARRRNPFLTGMITFLVLAYAIGHSWVLVFATGFSRCEDSVDHWVAKVVSWREDESGEVEYRLEHWCGVEVLGLPGRIEAYSCCEQACGGDGCADWWEKDGMVNISHLVALGQVASGIAQPGGQLVDTPYVTIEWEEDMVRTFYGQLPGTEDRVEGAVVEVARHPQGNQLGAATGDEQVAACPMGSSLLQGATAGRYKAMEVGPEALVGGRVQVWTDGSVIGSRCGVGAVVFDREVRERATISAGVRGWVSSTKAEITAALLGISLVQGWLDIEVMTDSQGLVQGYQRHMEGQRGGVLGWRGQLQTRYYQEWAALRHV